MYNIVIVRYGEIAVKGKNKPVFEKKLVANIKNALRSLGNINVYRKHGRILIDVEGHDHEAVIEEAKKVFGVFSLSPAILVEKDFEKLEEKCLELLSEKVEFEDVCTFKVDSKRTDKSFPLKSPEISREIGAYLLSKLSDSVSVDVNNPDVMVYAEIREDCYICFTEKIRGYGGMPLGTNGKALVLLSGGIDSPVAAWMIAKRGVEIEAIHYHSYPFTNERSLEKVKDLARILSKYSGPVKFYSVNLLPIQKMINEHCPQDELTIIARRFMMKIAERVARLKGCNALVTGESIGQVASQTINGLEVTDGAVQIPVFRPLIALDKIEIIAISEKIGTYETSIIPEEDCCTVFLPKHPVTKPRLDRIEKSESVLPVEELIENAIESMEVEVIGYE